MRHDLRQCPTQGVTLFLVGVLVGICFYPPFHFSMQRFLPSTVDNIFSPPPLALAPPVPAHLNISSPPLLLPSSPHIESIVHIADDAAKRMTELLVGCGEVCNTSITGVQSKFFPRLTKIINCTGLWGNAAIDASRSPGQAPEIPVSLIKHFSYAGKISMKRYKKQLLTRQYLNTKALFSVWTKEMIEEGRAQCGKGELEGTYGRGVTASLLAGLQQMASIKNGHVLVVGSERPWVESCLLFAGARMVTTLEYGAIASEHPQVNTLVPHAARAAFAAGTLPLFDAVVTFSSVEHSGLGRYGDALNPWGDLQSVARAWCVTRPGGGLLLGVPVGPDQIMFNAHRVYGPVMLSHLTANWDQVSRKKGGGQPVQIFTKPNF